MITFAGIDPGQAHQVITLAGIDPGLVHTGVVVTQISVSTKAFVSSPKLFDACPENQIRLFIEQYEPHDIFIEGYRPRSNLNHDRTMQTNVAMLSNNMVSNNMPSRVLDNMDSKNVVTNDLMKLLKLYNFSTRSHHQDLRSAARIMLFGAIKDPHYNNVLATMVLEELTNPGSWHIVTY